jgi:dATP pyrophosphohydrolase
VCRRQADWVFLLLKRIAMPKYGLSVFWQGVTGGVEDQESALQAAERELREETGITSSSLHDTGHSVTIPLQPEWVKQYAAGTTGIVEYTFVCVLDTEVKPSLSWEHTEYAWLSFDQAMSRLHYEGNKDALSAVRDWLTRQDKQ